MDFNFSLFFTALGLAAVIESLPWLIGPKSMRKFLETLSETGDEALRMYGASLLVIGVIIMWIATSFLK